MNEELELIVMKLVAIIIGDVRHPDYERVNKLAKMYNSFVTGIGLDELMVGSEGWHI